MVLERLVSPSQIEGHPWELFFVGLLHSNIGIIAAYVLVRQFASLTSVAFTVILTLPFVYYSLNAEESKYNTLKTETALLKAHSGFFKKFLYLFLGFMVTYLGWYTFSSEEVNQTMFYTQHLTIQQINSFVTGNFQYFSTLLMIFSHNVKVLLICIILSFFFGSGAIYIITWNASVLGAGMGAKLRAGIAAASKEIGAPNLAIYFSGASFSFLAYLIHAVPEILAYIVGGVIGGILSFSYVKRELHGAKLRKIGEDMITLFTIALGLLVVAGLLEVFVSPHFL